MNNSSFVRRLLAMLLLGCLQWHVSAVAGELPVTVAENWTLMERAGGSTILALAEPDRSSSLAAELIGRIDAFDSLVGIGERSPNLLLVWVEDPTSCDDFGFEPATSFHQLMIPSDRFGGGLGGAIWLGCGPVGTIRAQVGRAANRWQVATRVPAFPRFLQVGLIEFLDQVELEGNRVTVGLARESLDLVRNTGGPWMSFERASQVPWDLVVPAERPGLAAQAWGFVHYFLMGPEDRAEELREAHRLSQFGASFPIAFLEATGDRLDVRTSTIKRYAGKKKIESVDSVRMIETRPLVGMDPSSARLLTELARTWTALGLDRWAEEAFTRAEAAGDTDESARAAAGLGFSARARADHEQAELAFSRATTEAPTNPVWSLEAARSLLVGSGGDGADEQQQAATRAIELLRSSADVDARHSETWTQLAVAIERAEQLDPQLRAWLEGHYQVAGDRQGDVAVALFTLYSRTADGRQAAMELVAKHQELRQLPTFSDAGLVEVVGEVSLETAMRWVQEERYAEALVALESLRSRGQSQGLDQQLTGEIQRLREVVAHNTYVEKYNEAAKLFNEQQFRAAAELLEPMLPDTEDAVRKAKIEKLLAESLEWARKTGQ